MAIMEVIMPKMGESIMEATVLNWLKKPGDYVEADEFILEVATDKIDTEVPSPVSGYLQKIIIPVGEIATIGKAICVIDSTENSAEPSPSTSTVTMFPQHEELALLTDVSLGILGQNEEKSNPWISPLIKQICLQENVTQRELSTIKGSGLDQRVTKKDVLNYIAVRNSKRMIASGTLSQGPGLRLPGDVVIEMDRMRKMISERMVDSKRIAPHVTSFLEADMTAMVTWRETEKANFLAKYKEPITYTPLLIMATAKALKDFPGMNISVEGNYLVQHEQINIGMAVALPNGNLIVPVIHEVDKLSLLELTKKVNDLSNRARLNKLTPFDLEGGTYSISNIGSFGNLMGTPIIVQPQVGILAFGVIEKKPAVISGPQGDQIAIRQKMFISHSYDHRVIDGSLGGGFLKRVSDYLEKFNISDHEL
ncbi:2-oxo acid dehydrogenase subunit E2 [Aquirufa nivalisilvae]|uniref:Dihydrolipoamide acetyltransferase component of pyruvate dehydrogenase complex n=1 Tax=Aquirufa nivalisilvae TaxID=2516557 RepID=A0A2S2DVD0_9BACT|nr:dihydrolipoamide acetyltransferase family protein [Aquirufa nivalisilvae]AWL09374.1 Dihydrolipoyllysine-residue succinyltransferase [Aquirufa nivalisilvae]MCZ2482476.1 2-oxo acid dehydrogenase subunit E2 [Aquirufa nivalisilvae]